MKTILINTLFLILLCFLALTAFAEEPHPYKIETLKEQGQQTQFKLNETQYTLFVGTRIAKHNEHCFFQTSSISGISNLTDNNTISTPNYIVETSKISCNSLNKKQNFTHSNEKQTHIFNLK